MRLKLIACKIMSREICQAAAKSPNYIDISFMRQGLHNEPSTLSSALQHEIDLIDAGEDIHSDTREYDAVLLGYGLCSGGITGVHSQRYTMVIPRAHDCTSIFLGSSKRYQELFDQYSGGIYWYTVGWLENCLMPSRETEIAKYNQYFSRYGKENADYLIDNEHECLKRYRAGAFIKTTATPDGCGQEVKKSCEYYSWQYLGIDGDGRLLTDFLNGSWDRDRFLILPPKSSAQPSFDSRIIKPSE